MKSKIQDSSSVDSTDRQCSLSLQLLFRPLHPPVGRENPAAITRTYLTSPYVCATLQFSTTPICDRHSTPSFAATLQTLALPCFKTSIVGSVSEHDHSQIQLLIASFGPPRCRSSILGLLPHYLPGDVACIYAHLFVAVLLLPLPCILQARCQGRESSLISAFSLGVRQNRIQTETAEGCCSGNACFSIKKVTIGTLFRSNQAHLYHVGMRN